MHQVTVKKSELLLTLKKNRGEHRKIFEEAQQGYREEAISLLDKALEDARKGKEIRTFIHLEAPVDQTKDYDRAIKMLEMEVEEEITLTQNEFSQYVLDDWTWKSQFVTTNALYMKSAK
jgi:hypothetical protein